MRFEPLIDHATLVAVLHDEYDVQAEELTFLPYGYASACYRVSRPKAAPLFLKVWPATPSGESNPSWRAETLTLLHAFQERGVPVQVAAPLSTRTGELWTIAEETPLALFPFIAGERPLWTPQLRNELAASIAVVHRATPVLHDYLPAYKDFAIPRSAPIRDRLAQLARIGPDARPGIRALRDALLPRRAELMLQLDRLERLREVVSMLPGPTVLCHTDIGDDNLIVSPDGYLAILDWDEACVAPPEYDLYELAAQHGIAFLRAYEAASGGVLLQRDHIAFALLSRAVGDMAVRFLDILAGGMTADAEMDALAGIETWGFGRWRRLDHVLTALTPALH